MKLSNLTKLITIGATAFIMTACGGGGSSSPGNDTASTPTPPISTTPPIGPNGNIKLLPGYRYSCWHVDRYEFYVSKKGYILIDGDLGYSFYDSNYNRIFPKFEQRSNSDTSVGEFEPGQYYLEPVTAFCGWNEGGDGSFIVQSDILY